MEQLGIPTSVLINMLYKQIIMKKGIPFSVSLVNEPKAVSDMSKAEFDANAANLMDKVADVKSEITRLETQLEESFSKLSTAMENMDKASTVIENQVMEYRTKVDKIDTSVQYIPDEEKTELPKPKAAVKKTLTDSVLDTITRLLEK